MSRFTLHAAVGLLMLVLSQLLALPAARAEVAYLEPDAAFRMSARMLDPRTVAVQYEIADGYYMYRERFAFAASGATLGKPAIPVGKVKFDETFQKDVETHRGSVTITIPVSTAGMFTLTVTSQGCADAGLCYAPQEASVRLVGAGGPAMATTATAATAAIAVAPAAASAPAATPAPQPGAAVELASVPSVLTAAACTLPAPAGAAPGQRPAPASELAGIASLLGGGQLLIILPAFILLGLGLAFTPCVLPMVPILAAIIVGEGAQSRRLRGLVLALAYSLGMATVYTALGVAAGLVGEGLAAALQHPYVLGGFGVLMVVMALSMFGLYQLQLPVALQQRLVDASGRQSGGKLIGVFVMGAISALIVGPCVAAPLAGALVYISQTRDVVIGGAALFAMAIGMSIPLLLVGVSAGALLPRAGAWMDAVKKFFGVLMLGMALWMVAPLLSPLAQMLAWGSLLAGYAIYLACSTRHRGALAGAALVGLLGGAQLAGAATGGRDSFAPLAHLGIGSAREGLHFQRIKTVAELDAALAATGGKNAMLDFYADWCVSCKEMEKFTFTDGDVKARLAGTVLLQVDVTANDADDKAMLKRFKLFGPPAIILFDACGGEIPDSRVIGYQNPAKFSASLQRLE
jgi:thiol:disulfide interchange protein DsbD